MNYELIDKITPETTKMSNEEESTVLEAQESLLYSARNGEASIIKGLLTARNENKLTFNINCKGCNKSNLGWTPLQLATYFGHVEVVNLLIDAGADLNEVNENGDTALHKASFIGHEELVILLLTHKADLSILNGEGRTAKDVAKTHDVLRLIEAAEDAEKTDKERKLLTAAKEGRVKEIHELLSLPAPPHINSVDAQGNTCLHAAAYRGHAQVAIMLLQNGINTFIKNNTGQFAVDLAKDDEMREILSVRPVQRLQKMPAKFEGTLIKKSRFFGWKSYWVVLQRGGLTYYACRSDASQLLNAKPRKYLDKAKVVPNENTHNGFTVTFNDGDVHRLTTPSHIRDYRNVWISAIMDHVSYSEYYLWGGATETASEAADVFGDDSKPLGTLQDALDAASANLQVLETQLKECAAIVAALDKCGEVSALHESAYMRFQHACGSGTEALSSLQHCVDLIFQAKDSDQNKLKREKERNRVLEQALQALARTHHALEMSVAEELSVEKSKRKSGSVRCSQYQSVMEDKFFDIVDDEDDTLVESGLSSPLGTLSPEGSPEDPLRMSIEGISHDEMATNDKLDYNNQIMDSEHSLYSAISVASSLGTLVSQGGHVYRNARRNMPYTPSSHCSQWSV